MNEALPQIIEASEITMISDGWFTTMAHRKRELKRRMGNSAPFISVFGSAMTMKGSRDWIRAHEVGVALAKAGAVVMNGGYGGIMEAVSEGAALAGGAVVGITCLDLPEKSPNQYVTDDWTAERWDQRLLALVWLADGYIVCPGSSGTLVELSMVIETQLKSFLPIRPAVCLGSFWKNVVTRIIDTDKIIKYASTPVIAAQLALGQTPVKSMRHSRSKSTKHT